MSMLSKAARFMSPTVRGLRGHRPRYLHGDRSTFRPVPLERYRMHSATRTFSSCPDGVTATRSLAVIGAGHVGIASAVSICLKGLADEITIVDKDQRRAWGEALDLQHASGLMGRTTVRSVDITDLNNPDVVIMTAGIGQKPGQSRLELVAQNAELTESLAKQLDVYAPGAIVVIATNPVDILTQVFQEISNRPIESIFGTGTLIDTTRFHTVLGQYYGVDPTSVSGYILGEHGDSEVAAWSTVTIGGLKITENRVLGKEFDLDKLNSLARNVVRSPYEVIESKGYTNWAIGVCIARIVDAILKDSKSILPVSTRLMGHYGIHDVCLSVPTCVGRHGADIIDTELSLSSNEIGLLQKSAKQLKEALDALRA